jgi:hypothetical protein
MNTYSKCSVNVRSAFSPCVSGVPAKHLEFGISVLQKFLRLGDLRGPSDQATPPSQDTRPARRCAFPGRSVMRRPHRLTADPMRWTTMSSHIALTFFNHRHQGLGWRGQAAAYHPDLFRTADFLISFNPRATGDACGARWSNGMSGRELQVGASLLSAFAFMIGGTLRVGLPMSLQSFGFVPDAFSPPALVVVVLLLVEPTARPCPPI